MIDFWNVLTHSLWILGAAIVLATWSQLDWSSARQGKGLRHTVKHALPSPGISFGLALVCLGAGLGIAEWWPRVPWFLLALALALHWAWMELHSREDSAA